MESLDPQVWASVPWHDASSSSYAFVTALSSAAVSSWPVRCGRRSLKTCPGFAPPTEIWRTVLALTLLPLLNRRDATALTTLWLFRVTSQFFVVKAEVPISVI